MGWSGKLKRVPPKTGREKEGACKRKKGSVKRVGGGVFVTWGKRPGGGEPIRAFGGKGVWKILGGGEGPCGGKGIRD